MGKQIIHEGEYTEENGRHADESGFRHQDSFT